MKITDTSERTNKGYDDKKEFTCVCCGKTVLLTKFASAKTAKCPECKSAGKNINPDLVPASTPKKQQAEISGNTKTLPCVKCGAMVEVSKFMSAAKVVCDDCKGDGYIVPSKLKIDISKVDRDKIPSIEEYNAMPSNISNKKLRSVTCPACGEPHMRVLNVLDFSKSGLIVAYQCDNCKLLMNVSEQCYHRCKVYKPGHFIDYSGHDMIGIMTTMEHTRAYGIINRLYDIIKEHNIPIEGIELPPYVYAEQKPVPIGFTISNEDKWIKAVDDIIHLLDDSKRQGDDVDMPEGSRYITISDTLAKQLSNRLKELFKADKEKE